MLSYGKVWDIYMESNRNMATTASKLLEIHGPCLGSLESLKSKIRRILAKRPHKIEMRETWREQLLFADEAVPIEDFKPATTGLDHGGCREGSGRVKMRLSDGPSKRTVHSIMQPKIDELLGFAEEQGISYDEVLDLLKEKKNKKQRSVTEIPVNDAVAFFFNQEHSARSWTELRLFLANFDVRLPTRNEIDSCKKEMLPDGIKCSEIKSDISLDNLVDNTVKG